MKKRFVSIILFILIGIMVFSLVACGYDEAANGEGNTAPSEEEKEEEKGTRSNPVELNETIEWKVKFYADIDDWDELEGLANVTLNEVYEGEEALYMLYFTDEALDDVEEGYTFAVADMTIELLEGEEDVPYKTSFEIGSVSEDGRKSPFAYASLSDEYEDNEYTDLYPGGSVDIKQAFLIPIDGEYLVEIEENISGSKFFNHE